MNKVDDVLNIRTLFMIVSTCYAFKESFKTVIQ